MYSRTKTHLRVQLRFIQRSTMTNRNIRYCALTVGLIMATTSCTTVYRVDRRDFDRMQALLRERPASDIRVPAKTANSQYTYLRASTVSTREKRKHWVRVEATSARSPLIYSGLAIIGAGLVAMLAFGVAGEVQAQQEDYDKYAADGWMIGSLALSYGILLGGPLSLTGLVFDSPECDAPAPASWPSMPHKISK